jgi:AbrB family looped-hinge helix DNA binding protein
MAEATLSANNQIVIPKEAREALGLQAGDKVLIVVRGKRVMVLEKPERYHAVLRGLANRKFPKRFLETERNDWD